MIFNVTGGGASLNFKVVGNPQPSNPSENTIWINTDTEITSWIFSATEPEAPAEGMVWIPTGTSSTAGFNALKKNGIQVYPISAKQYVGGAWVEKNAKSYQDGVWVDWLIYLYKEGNEYANFTGGWVNTQYRSSFTQLCTMSKNANGITLSKSSSTSSQNNMGFAHAAHKIDLTGIKTIRANISSFNVEGTGNSLWLAVADVESGMTSGTGVASIKIESAGEVFLDVTSIMGEYFVGIMLICSSPSLNCTATFNEVVLK